MGAKQSKRSVDISGKEAENAGEVAAAGAGGEGRLEQLADADVKPQINGDAHIQPAVEVTEKELDSGTPENEKDATTEKEEKQKEQSEKESTPITNGETEPKTENGESTPATEEGKKPKKEKVKKKWSIRSISFSRKDKPKQEKKSKDKEEEAKTNGEPEKVNEEAAEIPAEAVGDKKVDDSKVEIEDIKDDKTPETPVTEPLTNGSSTPETPKEENPVAVIESSDAAVPPTNNLENDRPGLKAIPESEQLPINGPSLEETQPETPEKKDTKTEEQIVETTEQELKPETPEKLEVCVDPMPTAESSPPPLPANPPPSSVASFAATTMAPELTDASLANETETASHTLKPIPNSKVYEDKPAQIQTNLTENVNETKNIDCLNNKTDPETITGETANMNLDEVMAESTNIGNMLIKSNDANTELGVDTHNMVHDGAIENESTGNEIQCLQEQSNCDKLPVTNDNDSAISQKSTNETENVVEKYASEKKEIVSEIASFDSTTAVSSVEEISNQIINITETEVKEVDNKINLENSHVDVTPGVELIPNDNSNNYMDMDETVDNHSMEPEAKVIENAINDENTKSQVEISNDSSTKLIDTMDMDEKIIENVINDGSEKPQVEISSENSTSDASLLGAIETFAPVPVPESLSESVADLPLPPPPLDEEMLPQIEDVNQKGDAKIVNEVQKVILDTTYQSTNGINMEKINGNATIDEMVEGSKAVECNGNIEKTDAASPVEKSDLTTQESVPMPDKLADLVPEIPTIPELKTETLQESSSEVALVN